MSDLDIRPCSYDEAKSAVMAWHYSRKMPRCRMACFGVWEDGGFVGCVLFGIGANKNLFSPYGLSMTAGRELLRVALNGHRTPVSRIVAISLRLLRRQLPDVRLVISFADPDQGHAGGIYQAGNWIYADMTVASDEYLVDGVRMHGRALRATRSTSPLRSVPARNIQEWAEKALGSVVLKVQGSSKHRYLMPLDDEIRSRILPLAKPYPRAASIAGDAPAPQAGQGGSTPTAALSHPARDRHPNRPGAA